MKKSASEVLCLDRGPESGVWNMFDHDCRALPPPLFTTSTVGLFLRVRYPDPPPLLTAPPVLQLKLTDLSLEVSGVINPTLDSLRSHAEEVVFPRDGGRGSTVSCGLLLENFNVLLVELVRLELSGVL